MQIGALSSLFQGQMPGGVDLDKLSKAVPNDGPNETLKIERATPSHAAPVQAPHGAPGSFGAILDHMVGEVNSKMEAGSAEQAKVLSGESSNLHQAMISMQEAGVAFSLMVEVRNKLVESYQEIMRMQV